ncbi:calcium/proton exchanger [Klebsiella pneumoniae]|nr:calcium/proton exchanger [Klebsiella pneumoniae]
MVTLIAFLTGNELRFGLGAPEMVVMVASLVLCHISFSTGRTNVLNGAAHMALFAAYLMTISPDPAFPPGGVRAKKKPAGFDAGRLFY